MLRKTLIALTAVGALGVSSAAIAAQGGHGGGPGGGHGGGPGGGHGATMHGGGGGWGGGARMGSSIAGGRVGGWGGSRFASQHTFTHSRTGFATVGTHRTAFFPHRFHHNRFRNAAFIGIGFGAGFYGGYDSCWRLVPTYWGGWQRVWVCDYDYPYWGY